MSCEFNPRAGSMYPATKSPTLKQDAFKRQSSKDMGHPSKGGRKGNPSILLGKMKMAAEAAAAVAHPFGSNYRGRLKAGLGGGRLMGQGLF